MKTEQLIEKAKAYAEANYTKGMDTFVECYGDDEWREFLRGDEGWGTPDITTWKDCKSMMDTMADIWSDRQADARNSAF